MYFFQIAAALAATAVAQQSSGADNPNPFKIGENTQVTAGQPATIKWTPTTSGTVTLTLRQGASNNLDKGTVIASSVPNSGSATYTLPADTVRNSDYTIEIMSDANPSEVNYTPQFVVESKNTVAPISSAMSSASMSASASSASTASDMSTASTASESSMMSTKTSTGASSSKTSGMSSTTTGAAASSAPSSGAGALHIPGFAALAIGAVVAL